jgi:hypothetical protein
MTKRPHRAEDGHYHIKGKTYKELFGSRIQVHNGTAYKTEGNLVKSQLFMNKWGRIVSALKHKTAKKENRLRKYGYGAKKGKFGYVRIGATKKASKGKSRKMKGGDDAAVAAPVEGAVEEEKAKAAAGEAAPVAGEGEGAAAPVAAPVAAAEEAPEV